MNAIKRKITHRVWYCLPQSLLGNKSSASQIVCQSLSSSFKVFRKSNSSTETSKNESSINHEFSSQTMLVFFEEDKTTAILNTSKVKQIIGGNKLEDGAIVVVEYDNADYEALVVKPHGKKKEDITYSYSIKLIYKNLRLDTAFYIYELFLLHFY